MGFPIRKSLDQSLFAAPQGLSQRTTSFIASQHQGIHRIPLRHLIDLIIHAHPSGSPRQTNTARAAALDPGTFYTGRAAWAHGSHKAGLAPGHQGSRRPLDLDQLASTPPSGPSPDPSRAEARRDQSAVKHDGHSIQTACPRPGNSPSQTPDPELGRP